MGLAGDRGWVRLGAASWCCRSAGPKSLLPGRSRGTHQAVSFCPLVIALRLISRSLCCAALLIFSGLAPTPGAGLLGCQ